MKQFSLLTFVAIPVKLDITIVEIEGTKMGSILFDGCPLFVHTARTGQIIVCIVS